MLLSVFVFPKTHNTIQNRSENFKKCLIVSSPYTIHSAIPNLPTKSRTSSTWSQFQSGGEELQMVITISAWILSIGKFGLRIPFKILPLFKKFFDSSTHNVLSLKFFLKFPKSG